MAPNGSAWLAHVEQALEVPPDVPEPVGGLCLEALPDAIAHLRLRSGVPECVRGAAKSGQFCTVVQEPGAATAWVPTRVLRLAEEDGVDEMDQGVGWCVLRIGRSGSGKAGLKGPAPAGSSAAVCSILASERVAARLLSASGSEVLLVPQNLLPEAASALVAHGHAVWPAAHVCEPAGGALPVGSPALARQLAGAWRLVHREEPLGTVVAEYTEGDGPIRLQAPSGHFVEIRVPVGDGGASGVNIKEASFGGRCSVGEEGGHVLATQLRAVDFQPPSARPPRSQVLFGATSFEVVSHPGGDHRELWARLADADGEFVALELESEAPEPKQPRSGVWVFVGARFARVLGPRRGAGLIAGTCCRSLAQLQKLRGSADVRYELLEHYEAAFGLVEEPGLLRTQRAASRPEQAGKVFYSASDTGSGEVVVDREQGTLLYAGPSGRRETWRIVEWTFDPFTPVAPPPAAGPASPSTSRTRAGASGEEEDEGAAENERLRQPAAQASSPPQRSAAMAADSDAEDGPMAIRSLSRSLPNIAYLDESAMPITLASPEQATPTQQAEVSPEPPQVSPLPAVPVEPVEKRSRSRKKKRKKREAGDKDEEGAGAGPARSRSRKKKRKKREAAEADEKERRAKPAEDEGEDAPAAPAAESPEPEKAAPAEPREDAAKRRKSRKDGAAEDAPRSRSRKRKKRKKREAAEKEEPPQEEEAPQDEDDDHPPTPLASPEPAPASPASPAASAAAAPSPEPEREATPVAAPSEPAPARRRKGRKDGPAGAASRSKSRKKKRRKREAAAGSDEEPPAAPRPKEASPPPAPAKGRRRERSRSRSAERRDRDRSGGGRAGRNAGGGRARSEARRERDGKRKKGRD